tara:strand:- start:683 stop:2800 length:2118 start_codon:yes stop_codon:yes gene_type:complete
MKTLIQNYSSGQISIENLPYPKIREDEILIKTSFSAVSLGTEASMINLAKKNIFGKALERPDLVKRVLDKAKQTSFSEAIQMSLNKLDTPVPLGYSASGRVIEVGKKIKNFKEGDFVSAIGSGFASHSEYIVVPEMMLAHAKENFLKESAFGMLGCISMHACRLSNVQLGGSSVAVLGSGLLGNISSQILKAYGSDVISYDPNEFKSNLLKKNGIKSFNFEEEFNTYIKSKYSTGVDLVIIACAVQNNKPLIHALDVIKNNGSIVVLGNLDISIDRQLMWEKQASIIVSKSGGYGALNPRYEVQGEDYPEDIIKWTQERNLKEFIRLIEQNLIDIKSIITREEDFKESISLYEDLISGRDQDNLGVVLNFSNLEENLEKKYIKNIKKTSSANHKFNLGVIGAGNHAVMTFLPVLKKIKKANLKTLVSKSPLKANHVSQKFSFGFCSTNKEDIFEDSEISHIISLERHSDHLDTIKSSISYKKALLIEKPLCTSREELDSLKLFLENQEELPKIIIGHNRRYSKIIKKLLENLDYQSPMIINIRVNAGKIDEDHWLYNEEEGGNRVIAECSHFIDLIKYISKSKIKKLSASGLGSTKKRFENFSSSFTHDNGSLSNLIYFSEGSKSYSREIFEVIQNGCHYKITDFKVLEIYKAKRRKNSFKFDFGFQNQLDFFLSEAPELNYQDNLLDEINTMELTFDLVEELST